MVQKLLDRLKNMHVPIFKIVYENDDKLDRNLFLSLKAVHINLIEDKQVHYFYYLFVDANEEGSPSHKDFVSILTLAAVALFVTVTAAVCFVGLKNLYSKKFQKDAYQLETNYYGESKYDEPWNTPNV